MSLHLLAAAVRSGPKPHWPIYNVLLAICECADMGGRTRASVRRLSSVSSCTETLVSQSLEQLRLQGWIDVRPTLLGHIIQVDLAKIGARRMRPAFLSPERLLASPAAYIGPAD